MRLTYRAGLAILIVAGSVVAARTGMASEDGEIWVTAQNASELKIAGPGLREHLQRHIAPQPHIGGSVHVAHTSTGEQAHDAVRANDRARWQLGILLLLRELPGLKQQRGRFEKSFQVAARGRERLGLADEIGSFSRQPRAQAFSLGGVRRTPGVEPIRQRVPPFRRHGDDEASPSLGVGGRLDSATCPLRVRDRAKRAPCSSR